MSRPIRRLRHRNEGNAQQGRLSPKEERVIPINPLAIIAASLAAFAASAVYYGIFGSLAARYSPAWADASATPAWKIAQEPIRALVTAVVIAGLAAAIGLADVSGAVAYAAALWIGFPAMLLAGSVIHENVPWQLAAIHSGDWLLKLLIIAVIVAVW